MAAEKHTERLREKAIRRDRVGQAVRLGQRQTALEQGDAVVDVSAFQGNILTQV